MARITIAHKLMAADTPIMLAAVKTNTVTDQSTLTSQNYDAVLGTCRFVEVGNPMGSAINSIPALAPVGDFLKLGPNDPLGSRKVTVLEQPRHGILQLDTKWADALTGGGPWHYSPDTNYYSSCPVGGATSWRISDAGGDESSVVALTSWAVSGDIGNIVAPVSDIALSFDDLPVVPLTKPPATYHHPRRYRGSRLLIERHGRSARRVSRGACATALSPRCRGSLARPLHCM